MSGARRATRAPRGATGRGLRGDAEAGRAHADGAQALLERAVALEAERVVRIGLHDLAKPEQRTPKAAAQTEAARGGEPGQGSCDFGDDMRVHVTGRSSAHTHLRFVSGARRRDFTQARGPSGDVMSPDYGRGMSGLVIRRNFAPARTAGYGEGPTETAAPRGGSRRRVPGSQRTVSAARLPVSERCDEPQPHF